MAYMRKEWKDGDIITPESLNNIEEGISESQKEHAKTVDLPPGTYGGLDTSNSTYKIPNITVDNNGRVADLSQSVLPGATSYRVGVVTPNLHKSLKLQRVYRDRHITRFYHNGEASYSFHDTIVIPDGIDYDNSGLPKVENIWVIAPNAEAVNKSIKIKANFACWRQYDSKGVLYIIYKIINTSEIGALIEELNPNNEETETYYPIAVEYWCINPDENTMTM